MRTSNQLNQMRLNGARHFREQAGLSLIELMVAIVIGLFLTLGLSTMFLNMYSTSQSQGTVNQAQENQRLALVILTNTVQLAGFFAGIPTSTSQGATALPTLASNNSDGTNFLPGAGIVGKGAGTGTGATSDTLHIYYQTGGSAADGIINCQGGTGTAGASTTFVNSFSINSSYQLVCTVRTAGGAENTALVLANNVYSMTILYGVDALKRNGPTSTTTAYLDATDVQTNTLWNYVRSVQVTLNFFTPNALQPAAGYTASSPTTAWVQTINLMGKS